MPESIREQFATATVVSLLCVFGGLLLGCGGGETTESKGSIEDRLEAAKQIEDPATRANSLLKVAKEADESESIEAFNNALFLTKQTVKDIRDARRRTEAYVELITMLHDSGNRNDARDLMKETTKSFEAIKDPIERASAATKLAPLYGQTLGNSRGATSVLEGAVAAANEIEDPTFRISSLASIASAYDSLGMLTERDQTIDGVLQYARSLPDARKKADGLCEIAKRYQEIDGIPELLGDSASLLTEAIPVANDIESANSRAFALLGVAEAAKSMNLDAIGRQAFKAAEAAAEKIEVQSDKNTVMRKIDGMRSQFDG